MLSGEGEAVKEIEYRLNLRDADAFLRHQAREVDTSPIWFLGLFLGVGLIFCSCIGIPRGLDERFIPPALIMGVLVLLLTILLKRKWFHVSASFRLVGKDVDKFLAERHLRIAPESLTHATEFGMETLPWKAIEKIALSADHVFLFSSSTAAYIVPQDAFATGADFEEFVQLARRYHKRVTEQGGDERITSPGERRADKSEHIRPSRWPKN
jgi:hypothetical protein